MKLQKIKRILLQELRRKENILLFERARKRNPVFKHHNTPFLVLTALSDTSDNTYPQKEKLTRALIREQQSRPRPFWSSLLITAYLPMLIRLRTQIIGDIFLSDDLDQLVIYSFLEVIHRFPLSKWQDYTCVRLSNQTRRRVFQILRRERCYQGLLDRRCPEELNKKELEERHLWSFCNHSRGDFQNPDQLEKLLYQNVGDAIAADKLDLVVATKIYRENLREYIKCNSLALPTSTEEQNYQRLKRQRTRTLARLRQSCVRTGLFSSYPKSQCREDREG